MTQISIIVPVCDGANTIERCVQSLLDQTVARKQYEVIVVNDGSTDGTEEIVRGYDVRLLSQSNQGRAAARNSGICEARGEFLLFIDADCVAARHWIEEIIAPFSNREIIGVAGTLRTEQMGIVARYIQIEYEDKYDIMAKSHYVDIVDTASAAYRKRAFDQHGMFDTTLPWAEDTEFSFRLAHRGEQMAFAPRATVLHRHPNSVISYARRKWRYAHWRTVLYRRYPKKVVVDSRTPQAQRVQTALFFLLCGSSAGLALSQQFLGLIMTLLGLFLISTLPFCIKAGKKDLAVAVVSPLLLFVRAAAGGLGMVLGITHLMVGKFRNASFFQH